MYEMNKECYRPWLNYLIGNDALPETPNWNNTVWEEEIKSAYSNDFKYYISKDRIIYEVISADRVRNVSKLMTWGEIQTFGFNSVMKKCFRVKWIVDNIDQYIQYFSPVGHGIEVFSVLDGFGENGKTTLPLRPFLILKDSEDMFQPYNPSSEDLLAEDWVIVEHDMEVERNSIINRLKEIDETIKVMQKLTEDVADITDDIKELKEINSTSDLKDFKKESIEEFKTFNMVWQKADGYICNCVVGKIDKEFTQDKLDYKIEIFSGVDEEHEVPEYIVEIFVEGKQDAIFAFSYFYNNIQDYEHYTLEYLIGYINEKILKEEFKVIINLSENEFKEITKNGE